MKTIFGLIILTILTTSLSSNPVKHPDNDRGIRKLEKFSFLQCEFQLPEEGYLQYAEGQKKSLRAYPKVGDRFFLAFRELTRKLTLEELQEIFQSESNLKGNSSFLVFQVPFHADGNSVWKIHFVSMEFPLLITVFVRQEDIELTKSFLDFGWISTCRER